jgi:UDP-glucose 4-epimerase
MINSFLNENTILNVFGGDYKTKDGTCVRDYIYIMDLAKIHINVIEKMRNAKIGWEVYNVGRGIGLTVLDIINIFNNVTKTMLPFNIVDRRKGDVEISCANIDKIRTDFNWFPNTSIEEALFYAIKWRKNSL